MGPQWHGKMQWRWESFILIYFRLPRVLGLGGGCSTPPWSNSFCIFLINFSGTLLYIDSDFMRCYFMLYLDLWCTILCSILVLMINVILWIIIMDWQSYLICVMHYLYVACLQVYWDARGWFYFTHSGETGNTIILLCQCAYHICIYIFLYAHVVPWCKTLQVLVPSRYGVSTPPGFTDLSVPYMSDGSGGDSCWTLTWPVVTNMYVFSAGCLSCLVDMRVIVLWLGHLWVVIWLFFILHAFINLNGYLIEWMMLSYIGVIS